MLSIIENDIYITRGDSASLNITAVLDDTSPSTPYIFKAGEVLKLTVKKSSHAEKELITKTITISADTTSVEVALVPADTKPLEFGIHRYDVQLTHLDGSVDTIVPSTLFKVGDEIG